MKDEKNKKHWTKLHKVDNGTGTEDNLFYRNIQPRVKRKLKCLEINQCSTSARNKLITILEFHVFLSYLRSTQNLDCDDLCILLLCILWADQKATDLNSFLY